MSPVGAVQALLDAAPCWPTRIVCLTEETTEILYRIGCGDRVVGVSGYTCRPPEARQKPRVSSFLDAKFDRILELRPDLVLGFSDLQADIGRELARRGVPVYLFNQRSVAEVLQTVRVVAALVGEAARGEALALTLERNVRETAARAAALPRKPRVFFEEWPDPLISAIRWVSELVEIAGGVDVCAESRARHDAAGRIFTPEVIAARAPEVIIASWCGKKASYDRIAGRSAFSEVPAVLHDRLYEVKSTFILQPGPAALTDGLAQLERIIAEVAHDTRDTTVKPRTLRAFRPPVWADASEADA
jgi:iron complex transport system substrate-binding protein